jgi:hypothetical protein
MKEKKEQRWAKCIAGPSFVIFKKISNKKSRHYVVCK